jgi:hypothetical protein
MAGEQSDDAINREKFNATALVDGEETGSIEDVPSGNIVEFVHAHMAGSPWTPEQLADRVVVERAEEADS